MKILSKNVEKNGSGEVTLIPQESEDLWHLYNLIIPSSGAYGDRIRCSTIRRVQEESSTGSTKSERVKMVLTVTVEQVDYHPGAAVMRVSGKVVAESKFVRMGAYHTTDLEVNKKFTLIKDYWDLISMERLDQACDPSNTADVAAIVMSEGLAHVCLITSSMTILRARIEHTIPGKRKGQGNAAHDGAMSKFFELILQALIRHVKFSSTRCIILASPGFVKDDFHKFMMTEAQRRDIKAILENSDRFLLCHASSGHKHALKEVLNDEKIAAKLSNTKAQAEVKKLQEFYYYLKTDESRAYYGPSHVFKAQQLDAIQTLLITDDLFRASDLATRKKFVKLVEDVRTAGAEVRIFSVLHVSGEQLKQLSGIAAILRFPLELEDEDEEEQENHDDDSQHEGESSNSGNASGT